METVPKGADARIPMATYLMNGWAYIPLTPDDARTLAPSLNEVLVTIPTGDKLAILYLTPDDARTLAGELIREIKDRADILAAL